MNQNYILPNEWSIIEEGFEKERVMFFENIKIYGIRFK